MPRLRAVSSAADSATASDSLNSTSTLAVWRYCTLTASSTLPAADPALHARPDAPFGLGQRLRHAKLQVEMAMVDRPDGHGDRRGLGFPASPMRNPSCS